LSEKYDALIWIPNAVYSSAAGLGGNANVPLVIEHEGSLAGTLGFGSQDDSWDEPATKVEIANNWKSIKDHAGQAQLDIYAASGLTELLEAIASLVTGSFVLHL
jgi:hypothetical protein